MFGSTGEPWNPEPWLWLFEHVGGGALPDHQHLGRHRGRRVLPAALPIMPLKPCTLGQPAAGHGDGRLRPDGQPLRGEVGELVCTQPWPGMTRGIWGDPERYLDTYWRAGPTSGRTATGPRSTTTATGSSTAAATTRSRSRASASARPSIESALVGHPAVAEAAAVGVPHELKGEVVLVLRRPARRAASRTRSCATRLRARCARRSARPSRPPPSASPTALPKTRSAKIVRRAVRATVLGDDPGDISTLEDPAAIEAIRASV